MCPLPVCPASLPVHQRSHKHQRPTDTVRRTKSKKNKTVDRVRGRGGGPFFPPTGQDVNYRKVDVETFSPNFLWKERRPSCGPFHPSFSSISSSSPAPLAHQRVCLFRVCGAAVGGASIPSPSRLAGWLAGWRVIGRRRGRGLSVAGGGDDADVQEVVRVAQVLAEPLQRRLQQRLDAVDHHLVALVLACRGDKQVFLQSLFSSYMFASLFSLFSLWCHYL